MAFTMWKKLSQQCWRCPEPELLEHSDFFALDRQLVSLLTLFNNGNFRSVRTHFCIDWADKPNNFPDRTDTFARLWHLFLLTVWICNHSTAAKSFSFREWLKQQQILCNFPKKCKITRRISVLSGALGFQILGTALSVRNKSTKANGISLV